jgi:hypothetical protein
VSSVHSAAHGAIDGDGGFGCHVTTRLQATRQSNPFPAPETGAAIASTIRAYKKKGPPDEQAAQV